jgi:hypothetical protein
MPVDEGKVIKVRATANTHVIAITTNNFVATL